MRVTKTQSKTAAKTVGTSVPISIKATGLRKTGSSQAQKETKSTSISTVATSRNALTVASPKTTSVVAKPAMARHRIANWRADDADWDQLQVDRHRPAWHLAALAFGLKPIEDLEMRLQAARRVEEKNAYGDLIRTLQNNLTRVDELLQLSGLETHLAYDGLEAVQMAQSFLPDVVLLDIGLPKLNGFEVARKIRQQVWGKDMVLVALTGWGQDEDLRKSSEAGFNAHMVKPVDPFVLMELLNKIASPSA